MLIILDGDCSFSSVDLRGDWTTGLTFFLKAMAATLEKAEAATLINGEADIFEINLNNMNELNIREKKVLKHVYRFGIRIFGGIMICFFLVLYFFIIYSFVYDTVLFYHLRYNNLAITITMLITGLFAGNHI
jgi:hypothetical protein